MAKDRNEMLIERGALFKLPDSYFEGLSVQETLAFLNENSKYIFQIEDKKDYNARLVDYAFGNENNHSEGETVGVFDFNDGYIPASKKKRNAQKKSFAAKKEEAQDDDDPFIHRREYEGIQIVDVPIEIRPISQASDGSSSSEAFAGSPYRTTTINGERVVYAPVDAVMNGGMNPFGMMTPSITINPQNITINPQTVTMNPSVVTMHPDNVTMNPNIVTMNPETVTMNPNVVTMNPETVTMSPNVVNMNPEVVQIRPDVVQMKTESVSLNTDGVTIEADKLSVSDVKTTVVTDNKDSEISFVDAETQTTDTQAATQETPAQPKEKTLEERAGYKLKVEDNRLDINNDFINNLSTRIVGELKKDGVVFFSNSSANAAIESGLVYGSEETSEEPKQNTQETETVVADESKTKKPDGEVKAATKTTAQTVPAAAPQPEIVETEEDQRFVEPEIVEIKDRAADAPVGQSKAKKQSVFAKLWGRILKIFGVKNKQAEVKSLPAGTSETSKKKADKGKIEGIESLGSVYDFFNKKR